MSAPSSRSRRRLGPASPSARWHRRLARSRRGVTDVPLELLIIVIILAIVVPIIVAALLTFTKDQQISQSQEQANQVTDVVVQDFDDGINTTLLVAVNLPGDGVLQLGAPLYVGGNWNPQSAWITWGVLGDTNQFPVNNGATDVPMTNVTCSGNAATGSVVFTYSQLNVGSGPHTLALTKEAPGSFLCGTAITGLPFVEVTQIV